MSCDPTARFESEAALWRNDDTFEHTFKTARTNDAAQEAGAQRFSPPGCFHFVLLRALYVVDLRCESSLKAKYFHSGCDSLLQRLGANTGGDLCCLIFWIFVTGRWSYIVATE